MHRWLRSWLRSSLPCAICFLAGCATTQLPPPVFAGSLTDALGVEREKLALEDPFRLDAESRAWLHARIPDTLPRHDRLRALVGLFRDDGPLALRYELARSTSARETLAAGEGNCLSFTILFVALARELGLEAWVQEVTIPESRSRLADVTVANRHVVAWGRLDGRAWEVDFGFFSRPDGTRELRTAVGTVPGLAQGWTNLGVALSRSGEHAGAEFAFRRALRAEPGDGSALSGLLALYREAAPEAASELEARMPQLLARNPYFLYAEGLERQRDGDFAAAERHFRRALRLQPDEPWFHVALVRNRLSNGEVDDAVGALRRARQDVADEAQYALLVSELLRSPKGRATRGAKGEGTPPKKRRRGS